VILNDKDSLSTCNSAEFLRVATVQVVDMTINAGK